MLIPPDASAVLLCSPTPAELILSTLVNMCASTGCGWIVHLLHRSHGNPYPSATDTQGFYFCRMSELNAVIQHRAHLVGQEVRHRYCPLTQKLVQHCKFFFRKHKFDFCICIPNFRTFCIRMTFETTGLIVLWCFQPLSYVWLQNVFRCDTWMISCKPLVFKVQ